MLFHALFSRWPHNFFLFLDIAYRALILGGYMVKNDAKMAQEVLNETLDLPKPIRYAHEQERFLKEA